MSYMTSLECGLCGKQYNADQIHTVCDECQRPLLVRYDLDEIQREWNRDSLKTRAPDMWRYQEVLPMRDMKKAIRLGEGYTPLFRAQRLGEALGMPDLFIKDEGLNPTGSFKARGLCAAVSRAFELGIRELVIPSAGNAAGAMAAYAAKAGMKAYVFMPKDVPQPFIQECRAYGAEVTLVDGLITDCGKIAKQMVDDRGWFTLSTLKEPYRIEGKKTMGYEVAEQLDWVLPDVIIYPTGGGTGLVGMWKAFDEMRQLGWIGGNTPRMVSVQADGCAPIIRAFHAGDEYAKPWDNAHTVAAGLRVPSAIGDFLMLRALHESKGTAVAVSDETLVEAQMRMSRLEGIFACPEGGATLAALETLLKAGWVKPQERVVLFNTGTGLKYPDAVTPVKDNK